MSLAAGVMTLYHAPPTMFALTQINMTDSLLGVVLSLATAAFWGVSPLFWASAGRRIGSFPVVLLRSLVSSIILLAAFPIYGLVMGWPRGISGYQVLWLSVSGFCGMGIGDVLVYEALVLLGARRTTQAIMLSPVSAVLLGWLWLGESLTGMTLAGIAIVLAATSYAVLGGRRSASEESREPGRVSALGIVLAVAGALCAGVGSVTARHAYAAGSLDLFAATVIRVSSAAIVLWAVPVVRGRGRQMVGHLRDAFVVSRILPGVLLGPVAGMFCYLGALKHTEAGVVSTLSSMSPLFMLPLVAMRYRVRIAPGVVIATLIAVGGVALISLR